MTTTASRSDRRRYWALARWALRSRRIWPTPGVPVRLLDLSPPDRARWAEARDGTQARPVLHQGEPQPHRSLGSLDDLSSLASADWIIEAVVERIDIKRALLATGRCRAGAGTLVTSNTSGIPIGALAEGRSDDFRRHWLGTHFFNPPRYLHLLELIPTAETDPECSSGWPGSPIIVSARASSSRRTRRTSSRTTSVSSASCRCCSGS